MGNPVFTNMEAAYKEVLMESMNHSAFSMEDSRLQELISDVSSGIIMELNRLNREFDLGNELYDWQVQSILQATIDAKKNAKYAFTSRLSKNAGRYKLRQLHMDSDVSVHNDSYTTREVYDELHRHLSDFGTENDRFCHIIYGYWNKVGDVLNSYRSDLNPQRLVHKLNERSYNSTMTLLSSQWVEVNSTGDIEVGPIEVEGYIHNPDSVVASNTEFRLENFRYKWQNTNGNDIIGEFPYIKSLKKVKAVFRCEFEFEVTKAVVVKAWAKWMSLGINCVWDQKKTSKHTSVQFKVEANVDQEEFRLKEKPVVNISLDKASEFLMKEAQLRQMKEQLKYDEQEVQMLTDARNDEIEGLMKDNLDESDSESVSSEVSSLTDDDSCMEVDSDDDENSESFFDRLREVTRTSGQNTNVDVSQSRNLVSSNTEDQVKRHLTTRHVTKQNVKYDHFTHKAAGNAGKVVVDKKGAMFTNADNFEALSRTDKNNFGGFVFEELTDGRIQASMTDAGKPVKVIQGDGLGKIKIDNSAPQPTPEYVDSSYVTRDGQHKVTQFKFTDHPDKLQDVTKASFEKWHAKPDSVTRPNELPNEYHLENIEVYAPADAANGNSFNVKVRKDPETGIPEFKNIKPKSVIEIDGVVTEVPNVAEVDKFSQDNFNELKDMATDMGTLRSQRKTLTKLEKNLQKQQDTVSRMKNTDPENMRAIESLENRVQEKQMEVNAARKELKKQERSLDEKAGKLQSTDSKAARRRLLKGIGLQIAVGALIDGATTFVITLSEQIKLYKEGEISFGEMSKTVALQTGKAVTRGGIIAGALVGTQLGLQQMALASSRVISGIGTIGANALGPALLIGGLSYQTYGILKAYNTGNITTGEMQRQMGRMVTNTGLSIGGMVGSIAILGTGPAGLLVGAGACIAVALGDYFWGDDIWRLIFDDDAQEVRAKQIRHCKEFEEKVVAEAYEFFNLEENCSDEELNEAKRVGYLKYHPDKCQGSQSEKDEVTKKFQALLAAYTLLKVKRGMS